MSWGDNMSQVYIGKIVSTHGIRGEIKILSDFPYKDKVFQIGKYLIIENQSYIIRSYRVHKKFDMVTLNDYHDINDVLFLMKKKVYVDKNSLELSSSEVLDEDLITYQVLTTDGKCGIIKEIFLAAPKNKVLRILFDQEVLIPLSSPMIRNISKDQKQVIVELLPGMIQGDRNEN